MTEYGLEGFLEGIEEKYPDVVEAIRRSLDM